jgi:hypothetical protein
LNSYAWNQQFADESEEHEYEEARAVLSRTPQKKAHLKLIGKKTLGRIFRLPQGIVDGYERVGM